MDDPPPAAVPKPCFVCAAPNGKDCTKCKSRQYCGKACQLVDWKGGHKEQCKQLAAKFRDRLLDTLMPENLKIKEALAIVDDVAPAAGSSAAPRLSAVETTALVMVHAANVDTPDWRSTCGICLDRLPDLSTEVAFLHCCCKQICRECAEKCVEYDRRCPLCLTPGPKSFAEMLHQLKKHVDKGRAEAQIELGDLYQEGSTGLKKSLKRAAQMFELAAVQGNAEAQTKLGYCYWVGCGVKINYKTAEMWYRCAAEQCYPDAQFNLGQSSYYGEGVAQSYAEAVKWWRLAAVQGHGRSLQGLGLCYENGRGVPREGDEALRFYKRAAARGCTSASLAIERRRSARRNPVDRRDRRCLSNDRQAPCTERITITRLLLLRVSGPIWVRDRLLAARGRSAIAQLRTTASHLSTLTRTPGPTML